MVGLDGGGKEHQRRTRQLREVAGDFMRQLGQPEAGEQGEQPGIGHGARIVFGVGLAAEGEGHGLGTRAARQVVHGVPGGQQRQHQQGNEGQAGRHLGGEPAWRPLQRERAEPEGEQAVAVGRESGQRGGQPVAAPLGQFQHVAERGDIDVAPGVASDETRHHVGQAQQQQRPARQGAGGALRDDGGGRVVHGGRRSKRAARWPGLPFFAGGGDPRQARIWITSCRNGCGSAPRGRPCCPRTFACRCRRGATRWRYPA